MSLRKQEQPPQLEPRKYTLEEYFEFEYNSEFRHEYHNGTIVRCAYTSEDHGIIIHNLDVMLGICLRRTDCQVFTSDRLIYVEPCASTFYPDLLIVCGERESYQYSKNMVATMNPSVLIEVSSRSTYDVDRVKKKRCYRKIKSLKQYILIEQDFKMIEAFEPHKEDEWVYKMYEEDHEIVKIGDCEIPLHEIYYKIDFPQPENVSDK